MAEEILYGLSQRAREDYPVYVQQFIPLLEANGELLLPDSEHTMHGALLYDLVRYFHAQSVLEIGTRNGKSTRIIVEALRQTGGKVTTIDRDPAASCAEVSEADQQRYLIRVIAHDMEVKWTAPIHVLFVDHSHTYWDTRQTLTKFWPFVTTPGAMLVADGDSHFDQGRAVKDFAESFKIGYLEDTRAQGHALFLKPCFPTRYRDKGPSRHLFFLEETEWHGGSVEVRAWDEQSSS